MRYATRATLLGALTTAAFPVYAAAAAGSLESSGGVRAPAAPLAGGVEYGSVPPRVPVLDGFSVQQTVAAGHLPRITLRFDETGVRTVAATLAITPVGARVPALKLRMGWIHTGRVVLVRWPRHAVLKPGTYSVSLSAHDHSNEAFLPNARVSTAASFTVTPPPAPKPPPPPTPQPTMQGAVFPLQGPHSFGGPENRFGAPRTGHVHQGQDVLAAEGTPVVAPVAGTILTADYQAGGAGYYVVEHTAEGFDFMFAHCQQNSVAVSTGEAVSAAQLLCEVGQTGDAEGPHLHFEMWVGGWQASSGHPIDPLPYLQEWEGAH